MEDSQCHKVTDVKPSLVMAWPQHSPAREFQVLERRFDWSKGTGDRCWRQGSGHLHDSRCQSSIPIGTGQQCLDFDYVAKLPKDGFGHVFWERESGEKVQREGELGVSLIMFQLHQLLGTDEILDRKTLKFPQSYEGPCGIEPVVPEEGSMAQRRCVLAPNTRDFEMVDGT